MRLLRRDCILIEHLEFERTASGLVLPEAYRRSTFSQSLHPLSRDLERLDAGGNKANVGRIVALPPGCPDGDLAVGQPILYDQHSAPDGFTIQHARAFRRWYGTAGFCFLIPFRSLCGLLDVEPTAGRFF